MSSTRSVSPGEAKSLGTGATGKVWDVWRDLRRPKKAWGGLDKSWEAWGGLERPEEARGGLGISGEVSGDLRGLEGLG